MRRIKSFLSFTTTIIFILAISGAFPQSNAQVEGDNPLEPVPGERRVRLLEHLSESFGYLSTRELGKFYDSLPVECRGGMSKEVWIAKSSVDALENWLEFSIREVHKDFARSTKGEMWVVSGCLKYQKDSKEVKSKAAFHVIWRSNEWMVCGFKKEISNGMEVPCSS